MHKGYPGLQRSEQYLPLFWRLAWDSHTLEQFLLFAASIIFFVYEEQAFLHTGTMVLGKVTQTDFHCIPQKTQQYHSLMVSVSLSEDLNLRGLVFSFLPVVVSTSRTKKWIGQVWLNLIAFYCSAGVRVVKTSSPCEAVFPTHKTASIFSS